jgi:signal transduction histidine kinase
MEEHGGSVQITSSEGQGTVVILRLQALARESIG